KAFPTRRSSDLLYGNKRKSQESSLSPISKCILSNCAVLKTLTIPPSPKSARDSFNSTTFWPNIDSSSSTVAGEKIPTPFGPETCKLKCMRLSPYFRGGLLSRPPPEGFPVVLGQPALLIFYLLI